MGAYTFAVDLRRYVGREQIVRLVMAQYGWGPEEGDPYAFLCDVVTDAEDRPQAYALTLLRLFGALPGDVLARWVRGVLEREPEDRESMAYALLALYAPQSADEASGRRRWWDELAEKLRGESGRWS